MKKIILAILILTSVFSLCACGSTEVAEPTPEPLKFSDDPSAIAVASESVVMLNCYDKKGELYCTGSAFQCFEDGIYVTNYHVIEGVDKIQGCTEKKLYFDIDEVIAADPDRDIAILKTSADPGVSVLPDGDSDVLTKGEDIVAIGSPKGFLNTVSKGTYSGITEIDGVNYIQFNASVSAGSSGGALFNNAGEIVGITAAQWEEGDDINFAVPINDVKAVWENKDDFSANVTEEQEFVAYTPTYVKNHDADFKDNEDFYVIGYYYERTVNCGDIDYRPISDSNSVPFRFWEELLIESSYLKTFATGQKLLFHCTGIKNAGDSLSRELLVDSIEQTDLNANNGFTDDKSKVSKDYISVKEYYYGNVNQNEANVVGGYISSKIYISIKNSQSGQKYRHYELYVVDNKSDAACIERDFTDLYMVDDPEGSAELAKESKKIAINCEISKEEYERLSPGDFVMIKIEKGTINGFPGIVGTIIG